MSQPEPLHPLVVQATASLAQGQISRREFLRLATLVGTSVATATLLSSCGGPGSTATPEATAAASEPEAQGGIKRGGAVSISAAANRGHALGQVLERLTRMDENNIARPHLLEGWQASDDLTAWTLTVRQGVRWSNGDELSAADVVQNVRLLLSEAVVEEIDQRTVSLELERPRLDIPEVLAWRDARVVHPDQIGNDLWDVGTIGTGPFVLQQVEDGGTGALLARRDDYWQAGEDGRPLPYLQALAFKDVGWTDEPMVAAMQAGEVDLAYVRANGYAALRETPTVRILSTPSSNAHVLRFRVDMEPWQDERVRLAVKKLQDRGKILNRAVYGQGVLGHDTHVWPMHPEFAEMTVPEYDPQEARALLQAAGVEKLAFSIALIQEFPEAVAFGETLQEDARAAGVEITLDRQPDFAYWTKWTEHPVGITYWAHRPLAVQLLPLAYTADADGNPVPWNESRWVDPEFSALLAEAQATPDLEARRAILANIQRIQSERGSIAIPYWGNVWLAANPAIRDVRALPGEEYELTHCWYDPELDPPV